MELRTTEQQVNEMLVLYESLRRHHDQSTNNSHNHFLMALELPDTHPGHAVLSSDENPQQQSSFATEEDELKALESLHATCVELEARMEKFQKKLDDKDPITQAPRYGAKTAERVQYLLTLYNVLKKGIWAAFGMIEDTDTDGSQVNNKNANTVVSSLRQTIEAQQAAAQNAELEAQQQLEQEKARQREEEEKARQEEERKRLEAEEAKRQEEQELARRAEEVRRAQRQAIEDAAQAERNWVNSIPKGPEGVRQQIQVLKDDTKDDPVAQKTALTALLQMFTQIAQHPEEVKFRRVRRDHKQFHQDIGRHKGGQELLIAAGFALTAIDDIPCFFSKEPDLESDMDGWSLWFDNLKANLEVVKEMQ